MVGCASVQEMKSGIVLVLPASSYLRHNIKGICFFEAINAVVVNGRFRPCGFQSLNNLLSLQNYIAKLVNRKN